MESRSEAERGSPGCTSTRGCCLSVCPPSDLPDLDSPLDQEGLDWTGLDWAGLGRVQGRQAGTETAGWLAGDGGRGSGSRGSRSTKQAGRAAGRHKATTTTTKKKKTGSEVPPCRAGQRYACTRRALRQCSRFARIRSGRTKVQSSQPASQASQPIRRDTRCQASSLSNGQPTPKGSTPAVRGTRSSYHTQEPTHSVSDEKLNSFDDTV